MVGVYQRSKVVGWVFRVSAASLVEPPARLTLVNCPEAHSHQTEVDVTCATLKLLSWVHEFFADQSAFRATLAYRCIDSCV